MTRRALIEMDEPQGDEPAEIIEAREVDRLVMAAQSEGTRAGAASQIDRFSAIFADDRSKGRERVCVKIACKAPDMSAEDVLDLAADAAPVIEQASNVRSIAERTIAAGANNVSGAAEPQKPEDKKRASGAAWGDVVGEQNKRTAARRGQLKSH